VNLSFTTLLIWWSAIFLEFVVLGLAWQRKLARRLPFLVVYLSLLLANEFIMFCIFRATGINSRVSFYAYWTLQALLVAFRAIVVYEVCRSVLSPFAGVWRAVNPVLCGIAGLLLFGAVVSPRGAHYRGSVAILAAQRGLEFVVAGLLIAGFAFCRYYGLRIEGYLAWIALGLGFHSIVQAADNTFLQYWPHHWSSHFAIWDGLRHFSFGIALVMWSFALWKPLPATQPRPVLLSHSEYENLSPLVTTRLRELNTRLLGMWK
jgi:hypothetical protein